jgi:LuxR family maltose regulon positive regulatory protein
LKLIGSGLSNKQIALSLNIAPETVKSHAKSIFAKLEVKSRTEAAVRAQQYGIL